MGKIIPMNCQGRKQKSTEKLGRFVKSQQRTSLNHYLFKPFVFTHNKRLDSERKMRDMDRAKVKIMS